MTDPAEDDALLARLLRLKPEELAALLEQLQAQAQQATAAIVSRSVVTGSGDATISVWGTGSGEAVPASAVTRHHVSVTDELRLRDEVTPAVTREVAEVATGLWTDVRPRDPQQALAYLQVLIPLIRVLLVIAAAAGTTAAAVYSVEVRTFVLDALRALPRVSAGELEGEPPPDPEPPAPPAAPVAGQP